MKNWGGFLKTCPNFCENLIKSISRFFVLNHKIGNVIKCCEIVRIVRIDGIESY